MSLAIPSTGSAVEIRMQSECGQAKSSSPARVALLAFSFLGSTEYTAINRVNNLNEVPFDRLGHVWIITPSCMSHDSSRQFYAWSSRCETAVK